MLYSGPVLSGRSKVVNGFCSTLFHGSWLLLCHLHIIQKNKVDDNIILNVTRVCYFMYILYKPIISFFSSPSRESTDVSITFRKSSLVTIASLCKGNTYFKEPPETLRKFITERLSRPLFNWSSSSFLVLNTRWMMIAWHALGLLFSLTN